jgi:hypothetical protein
VTSLREYFLGPVQTPLYLLWGAVALLLVMACANIANLLLIRASEREEEIAIRRALGASPARLLRQLLTEAVVLAVLGGAAGAVLAWWGTTVLAANGPDAIPRLSEATVNAHVLLYAVAVSLITGVLLGMAPARLLVVAVRCLVSSRGARRRDRGVEISRSAHHRQRRAVGLAARRFGFARPQFPQPDDRRCGLQSTVAAHVRGGAHARLTLTTRASTGFTISCLSACGPDPTW